MKEEFTKYEIARILGARALQIAMDAPILVKISKEQLEDLRYDALKIADLEFRSDVLPITVKRPLPKKTESTLKSAEPEKKTEKEKAETEQKEEKDKVVEEEKEEESVKEEGEIMELATPEDEIEEETNVQEEGI